MSVNHSTSHQAGSRLQSTGASSGCFFFFFNDTATTEIYTLSLHDALPISDAGRATVAGGRGAIGWIGHQSHLYGRSEEHTSELQSQSNLVCRLLLEKKKRWRRRP